MIKLVKACDYFDLYEVTENVYAAIKTNDICMNNTGVINLGDKVVVFDTFLSIKATKELKQMIIDMTGNDNFIIINSHSHLDHILGNCIFSKKTPIISSQGALENLDKYIHEIKLGKKYHLDEMKNLKEKLELSEDVDEILDIKNSLIIYENLSNDEGEIVLPNLTFKKEINIYGRLDNINLRVIDKAHSPGDVICTVDSKKVAFVGDLLFVDEHPYLGQGDPIKLIKELKILLDSDIEYFIPGHGAICKKDKIIEQIEYINSIIELVKNNMKRIKDLKIHNLPSKFHNYKGPAFRWNINFLSEYIKKQI